MPGRRLPLGSRRGARGGASAGGWRTSTVRARCRGWPRSRWRIAWLGLDWDRAGRGGRSPHLSQACTFYEEALARLAAAGPLPLPTVAQGPQGLASAPHGPEEAPIRRPSGRWICRTTGTSGTGREEQRDAGRPPFRVEDSEEVRFVGPVYGPQAERVDLSVGDFVLKRRDITMPTSWRWWWTTWRWGSRNRTGGRPPRLDGAGRSADRGPRQRARSTPVPLVVGPQGRSCQAGRLPHPPLSARGRCRARADMRPPGRLARTGRAGGGGYAARPRPPLRLGESAAGGVADSRAPWLDPRVDAPSAVTKRPYSGGILGSSMTSSPAVGRCNCSSC